VIEQFQPVQPDRREAVGLDVCPDEEPLSTPACIPCRDGEHADDGTGQACPCCGVYVPPVAIVLPGRG
jgi:hypothetical protein